MKKCPNCGSQMDDNQKHCLTCDYVETKGKKKYCPVCGELLIKDVCYKCGYRGRKAPNTCPHCHQKLIAGRCDRCNYSSTDWIWGAGVLVVIVAAFISWIVNLFR